MKKLGYPICIILILTLSVFLYKEFQNSQQSLLQIEALTDTVSFYKTKDGKNGAYITTLEGTRDQLLEISKKKDSASYELIKKIKKLETLVNLSTETKIDTITVVDTLLVTDSAGVVFKPHSLFVSKFLSNPYYAANVRIVNDSLDLKLKVYNKFRLVHRYESNGFFKPESLVIDVLNDNPYTVTTELSSYRIKPKPKKTGLKAALAGIAAAATFLILTK